MKYNQSKSRKLSGKSVGLSKLQKSVLKLAFQHQKKGLPISNRDALIQLFGFTPLTAVESVRAGGLLFSKKSIGYRRYNSASVSVARTFGRLKTRGLLVRKSANGLLLTPDGSKVAKILISQDKRPYRPQGFRPRTVNS